MKISTLIRLATYIVVFGIGIGGINTNLDDFCVFCIWACFIALCVELLVLAYKSAYKSHKTKTRGRIYATVIRDGARRVEDVVSATGLPYDVVKKDLSKFAKKGKGDFQGAYFNEATQEIIFTRNVPAANSNNAPAPPNAPATWNNPPASAPTQPAAPRNVCPACGASVAGVGRGGECEYCGSRLN